MKNEGWNPRSFVKHVCWIMLISSDVSTVTLRFWKILTNTLQWVQFHQKKMIKSVHLKRIPILIQFFVWLKVQKLFFIFLPAFYLIIWPLTSSMNFERNSHFENMTAGFLLRCQNLLRYFTPEMMHFQAWKKMILTNNNVITFDPIKI